jgi:hypothetical protein
MCGGIVSAMSLLSSLQIGADKPDIDPAFDGRLVRLKPTGGTRTDCLATLAARHQVFLPAGISFKKMSL